MSWTKIKPIGPRVLVKLDPPEDKLVHGALELVLPDLCQFQPVTGTVVAVSDGFNRRRQDPKRADRYHYDAHRERIGISVGERVVFGKYNGTPVDPPEHDPRGTYYMMDVAPMQNPYFPDVYGVIDPMPEGGK